MTLYGVTPQGFVIKTLEQIQNETMLAFQGLFGTGVDLDPRGPLGQIKGIMDEREASLWELAQELYNSQYPNTAEGVNQDNANSLVNIPRKPATLSTVAGCIAGGTPGTVIPALSQVSVAGNPAAVFLTNIEVTIGGGGTVTVDCTAQNTGAVAAPAGSLTVIDSLISGWDTFTNPNDALVGNDLETDSAYQARAQLEKQQSNAGPVEAIKNALEKVLNVTAATVIENTTMGTVAGVPAKSINCIVENGADQDVANAIFAAKPAGIQAFGSTVMTVTDSQGITHSIGFDRPTQVPIYVAITGTPKAGQTITTAAVKAAILAYGASLGLGDDVIVYPAMMAALGALPFETVSITISTAPTPTLDSNITIALSQLATFDASNIAVTIS